MRKNLLLIILVGLFFFGIKSSYAATEINSDLTSPTIWSKSGSPFIVKKSINILAPLTIEPGVVVKFNYGSSARLVIKNEFTAVGTNEENIFFTSLRNDEIGGDDNTDGQATKPGRSDWSGLIITDDPFYVTLKYILISYSSPGLWYRNVSQKETKMILENSEIRDNYEGLYIDKADPIIKGNIIKNNNTGIEISSNRENVIPTFRNNSIVENGIGLDGRSPYGAIPIKIDARYNWWGDISGPYYDYESTYEEKNLSGAGNRILGYGTSFRPWLKEDNHTMAKGNPVILVPGIGASINWDTMIGGKISDKWTIFSHTYDGIIEAIKNMGYEEGKDFFIGYYDWRQKNADSARDFLKPLIDKAKAETGASQVDIIAHSMGGIVARSYIQSDDYANDVDNLILIATPNKGSSDVYTIWEGGYVPKGWENGFVMRAYLGYLSAKGLTFNNYETVHGYIPSVKELMPLYDYVYSKNDYDQVKNYSEMNEINDFLAKLDQNTSKLNSRVRLSVIAGNEQSTLGSIPVVTVPEEHPLWKDGKPDPLDPENDSMNGDGRVLFSSAWLQGMYQNVLNYNHGEIVSQSEKIIASRILERLDTVYPAPDVFEEMGFWFASPVDVEIKAPDEKIITSDNINQIPLAKYAGESKPDGFKIFSIPNPIEGDYEIKITGNGSGEYHIGSEYADYTGNKTDHSSITEGTIALGEEKEYKVAYDPDNNQVPVGEIEFKDETPPTITGTTTTNPSANGWHSRDVTIHFEASDAESGVASITPDITISTEGADQSATGTATDNAGNTTNATVSGINIDKTKPEINITTPENKNYSNDQTLNFSYATDDSLSGIESHGALFDGQPAGESADLALLGLGDHTFKVTATDLGGNQSQQEVSFKTSTSIYSIINNTNHYRTLGFIKTDREKQFLLKNLKITASAISIVDALSKASAISPFLRNLLKKQLMRAVNGQIDFLVAYINKSASTISLAKNLLTESLKSIKFPM